MRHKLLLLLAGIIISAGVSMYAEEQPRLNSTAKQTSDIDIKKETSSLQIPFIKNEGQITSDDVRFYTKLFNGTVFITAKGELVYSILYPKDYIGADDPAGDILPPNNMPAQYTSETIRETLIVNQDESAINVRGINRAQTYVNYIISDAPKNSRDNISTYNLISLGEAWPGITLNLKANSRNIEKLFIVSPEGNPESIKISLDGIEQISLNKSGRPAGAAYGELEVTTAKGGMNFTRPVAYQNIEGERNQVEVAYKLINENTYGFTVGDYDKTRPLIIDPLLASTYIGGATADVSNGIARDSSGNIFIAGYTSGIYPTTAGVFQPSYSFTVDVVVSKFNSDITTLLASTFIGSQSQRSEYGYALAVDGSGNVFVTGTTGTAATPPTPPATAGAYDTSFNGSWDAFVAKLNNNLTSTDFVYTFLGGTGDDRGYGIATDKNNNVFVCGTAGNATFPATGGPYSTFGGGTVSDGFVARFGNNLTAAGFVSTFLGGSQGDFCYGITTDSSNNVIVTGGTSSPNFPTVPQVAQIGSSDVFVTKFNNGLTATLYSTRFGGTLSDVGYGIAIGRASNIHVTGETSSTNFPVRLTGGSSGLGGGIDAFITTLSPSLNIISSRYLGGNGTDIGWSIAIAPFAGQLFLTGYTASTNFPTYPINPPPLDATLSGPSDMFVTRLDNELSLVASTYLGGASTESSATVASQAGILMDSSTNVVLTSITDSSDFPLSNPILSPYNGGVYSGGGTPPSDIFVSRITPNLQGGTPITSDALAAPTISFPLNLASDVLTPPTLQWTAPENAIAPVTYAVYFSTDSYPLTIIYTGQDISTIPSTTYTTSYYWYIVASDSAGRVSWTSVYQFTTDIDPLFIGGSSGGELFGADSFTKPLGTCFIATAVYGSPTHPNVMALKEFRDNHLSTNFIGRYFVSWYYKVSPPVAEHLKHSPLQASVVRFALTPIIYTIKYPGLIALIILALGGLLVLRIKRSGC
ncbi:MAG TPA: SBBP repeat-containing protein [Planctomycetota bacterium]|nr:SBBP repeat-containing protein [Planctomycetota bacterium]